MDEPHAEPLPRRRDVKGGSWGAGLLDCTPPRVPGARRSSEAPTRTKQTSWSFSGKTDVSGLLTSFPLKTGARATCSCTLQGVLFFVVGSGFPLHGGMHYDSNRDCAFLLAGCVIMFRMGLHLYSGVSCVLDPVPFVQWNVFSTGIRCVRENVLFLFKWDSAQKKYVPLNTIRAYAYT